jgi:hypothetical protein
MQSIEKNVVLSKEEDYKKIEAEFFGSDYIIESDYVNYRIDKGGQRFYVRYLEEDKYLIAPSFSEVIRTVNGVPRELAEWFKGLTQEQIKFESVNSANYGTFLHIHFANILRGETVMLNEPFLLNKIENFCIENNHNYDDLYKWYKQKRRKIHDDTIGFICWIKDCNVRPIAMEYPLMHPDGLYAGTLDLICKLTFKKEDHISIIDFKSTQKNFYEENEIQLHAYRNLWIMENPDIFPTKLFNLGCNSFRRKTLHKYLSGEKTANFKPYSFKDQTESKNLYKWQLYLDLYHGDPENMKFDKIHEYDEIFPVNKDSDLSDIMYERDIIYEIIEGAKSEKQNN